MAVNDFNNLDTFEIEDNISNDKKETEKHSISNEKRVMRVKTVKRNCEAEKNEENSQMRNRLSLPDFHETIGPISSCEDLGCSKVLKKVKTRSNGTWAIDKEHGLKVFKSELRTREYSDWRKSSKLYVAQMVQFNSKKERQKVDKLSISEKEESELANRKKWANKFDFCDEKIKQRDVEIQSDCFRFSRLNSHLFSNQTGEEKKRRMSHYEFKGEKKDTIENEEKMKLENGNFWLTIKKLVSSKTKTTGGAKEIIKHTKSD